MPCSDSDSKDFRYVRKVFEFIDDPNTPLDNSKIFAEGFSQNSMFSAYIAFCYNHRVSGVWQGGSGMALNGKLFQNSRLSFNIFRVHTIKGDIGFEAYSYYYHTN